MYRQFRFYWVVLVLVIQSACTYNYSLIEDTPRGCLLESVPLRSFSKEMARKMVGDSIEADFFRYGIDAYRIKYATVYMEKTNRKKVITSALLLVPQDAPEEKLLGYFHGTNMPIPAFGGNNNIPSNYDFDKHKAKSEVTMMGIPFASAGFTVLLPDYVGFGETSALEHPFVYYPELDKEIIDGMLAARHFLKRTDRTPVWLTGWSQGGGAALTTMRYMQQDYRDEFEVKSTSALSGPYDFTTFLTSVLQNQDSTYLLINLYIWAGYVVNFFGVQRPTDQIFTSTITGQTAAILGSWGKPRDIFRPYFLSCVLAGRDTAYLGACDRNSCNKGWKPEAPVYLHHGSEDWVVPPFNSKNAYKGLAEAGGDITLYIHKGYSHFNCCYRYVNQTLHDWLDKE